MKVLCIMNFTVNPFSVIRDCVKEGEIYTVKGERYGYSTFYKRWVDTYSLYEVNGLYEKGIFIPLSDIEEKKIENYEMANTIHS